MKPGPVDVETYDRTRAILRFCRAYGLDEVEHLNRLGLLLTPEREHRLRVEAMRFIFTEMEQWRPAEFLRRKNKDLVASTPEELYTCIHEWIGDHITAAEEKT